MGSRGGWSSISKIEYVLEKSRVFIHLGADFFMRDAYGDARSFPMHVWDEHGQEVKGVMQPFDIAGPLCFAGDYLAHGAQLPHATAEDHWLSISSNGRKYIWFMVETLLKERPKISVLGWENYVFGVNAKQSIFNLTFEEQV